MHSVNITNVIYMQHLIEDVCMSINADTMRESHSPHIKVEDMMVPVLVMPVVKLYEQ
jgi:hypothetical protein